ncbi:MAG: hypothetical protein PF572_05560 [Patescibacteria group bacterium]|jgi:cbb3-type cytochrome oxidase subunit 3|nr:hypothetical protein [Patescibacteria group bacterium]
MSKIFSIKHLLIIIMAFFLFSGFIADSALALDSAKRGLNTTAQEGFDSHITEGSSISQTVGKVIGYVLSFVGVIFLILIIYAGFTWMLARGNEADVKKAKDLMYDAIIGLVIIMSAYAITAFVGNSLAN